MRRKEREREGVIVRYCINILIIEKKREGTEKDEGKRTNIT